MARNQSDSISLESQLEIKQVQNNSDFKCMSEVYEDGKLVHFLYNSNEKETLKAWKKSEVCNK